MTHAPSAGADDGGGGGGGNREANRRPQTPPDNKQVVPLLTPAQAKEAEAEAAAALAANGVALLLNEKVLCAECGGESPRPHRRPRAAPAYRPAATPTPPDGGWGWAVVFASFMIHVVNDGVTYSFGIFYDALITYFDSGRGETAWILSILVGVTLCSGPISSSLVNKYGCRPVTIAGAVLGSGSLLLSVFAPNVQTLYLTIGLGTGLGFGLVYLPAIVSVTCYFERLRSLATGIAVCGSGLGTFLLAPLTKELVDRFGWRHALLFVSAMVLKCAAYGALFRPLPPDDDKPQAEEMTPPPEELRLRAASGASDLRPLKEKQHLQLPPLAPSERALWEAEGELHRPRSMGHLAPGVGGVAFLPSRSALARTAAAANAANAATSNTSNTGGPASRFAKSQPALAVSYAHAGGVETKLATTNRGSGIMYRKDILYSGSLRNLQHHRSASQLQADSTHLLGASSVDVPCAPGPPCAASAALLPPSAPSCFLCATASSAGGLDDVHVHDEDEEDEDCPARPRRLCGCVALSPETDDALREMLDFSLLKDPIFIVFTVSNFLTSVGFNVPYLYVAVQAKSRGLNDDRAGWLLSAIGFANTVGRIVLGYISDKPWVNRLLVYNFCLTICGVATALSALCESFTAFMVYSCVFGASIGAYVGLTSVVLVDLLGLERLTNAFGLLLLFQGIASLIGPPIAGWLYDATESYDPGFIVAGVTMGISGVMLFVIPPMQRRIALLQKQCLEMRPVNGGTSSIAVA